MKHVFVNLAVFKVAWTAVVVSAAAGVPVVGAIAVAIAVGIRLWSCDNPEAEIRLLLVAATMGLAWESTLVLAGLLEYSSGTWMPISTKNIGTRMTSSGMIVCPLSMSSSMLFSASPRLSDSSLMDMLAVSLASRRNWVSIGV